MSTREAGRELDAEVCIALGIPGTIEFGARAPYRGENTYWSFSEDRRELEMTIAAVKDGWRVGSVVEEITHYPRVSEDIAAAWLVVEKLRGRFYFEMRTSGTLTRNPDGEHWATDEAVVARFVSVFAPRSFSSASTAPLVICLAAHR